MKKLAVGLLVVAISAVAAFGVAAGFGTPNSSTITAGNDCKDLPSHAELSGALATVVADTTGGLENGFFYAPTLLSNVTPDMLIYREETFGPVAPIICFDDEDDVVAMANDTNYGLAAYVYTQNLSRAMRTFEELQFGIIGINDINPTSAAAPFGGMKESGLGREGAREGIEEYLETKLGGFSI